MATNWEDQFTNWSKPPGKTEEQRAENAIQAIKNAVAASDKLQKRGVKVFVQGSYRNNVNVRQDSDVDVGVMCHDAFLAEYPDGKAHADFGNQASAYSYSQFKMELGEALVRYFGVNAVRKGNKAFDIRENSYHVEADCAPFFEFRQYYAPASYRCGVALIPDRGGIVQNYPERLLDTWPRAPLHYENGVQKNNQTSRAFKGSVRILKALRNQMEDAGLEVAKPIPGFLLECMLWNVADDRFDRPSWTEIIRSVLVSLWGGTETDASCKSWLEVNGIKYLFHSTQKWTRQQAHDFIYSAWNHVGYK